MMEGVLRYRLIRVIGSGGQAQVYEARAVGRHAFER